MIGEVLGSYRIVSAIGQGGMGVVYRAEHTLIGKQVAIKVLLREMTVDPLLVERFFNEARAAASVKHAGLVEVFDFGHHVDGSAYIVMELLEGESLGDRLGDDKRLPIATALAIARQVASALHAAHEQGIIHRDLKPENIFLVGDADAPGGLRTKVLDFGIAKLAGAEERRSVKTKTGAVFGTPRYMSPEQCRNATNVDRRADIYALGCILHEMLLGVAPFDYDNWGELIAAHIHETPPRPTELDPQLPGSVEAILLRALAKPLAERFQTMLDLAHEIEAVYKTLSEQRHAALFTPPAGMPIVRPRTSVSQAGTVEQGVAPTLPVTGELSRAPRSPRRGRPWLAIGAIAVAAAASIAIYVVATVRPAEPQVVRQVAPQPAAGPRQPEPPTPDKAVAIAPADATIAIAPADATVAVPAVARVTLTIRSTPVGADVYRASDGIKLGKTPLVRDYERTDGAIDLIVRMTGYRDARVSLPTTKDGITTIALRKRRRGDKPDKPDNVARPDVKPRGSGATVLDPYEEAR